VDCVGPEDQFGCKREEGDGSFAAVRLDASHSHPLWWGLDARWRMGLQAANQPLVGAEQFSIGGVDSVRGYYEAELLGDSGAHVGLEVSSPNWGGGPQGSWRAALTELRLHGYVEAGHVRVQNPSADDAPVTLAGAGLGLRYATGFGPIRLDVAAPVGGNTGKGVQVYVGLGQAF
jgi:hemolysin activation/secretion protein